MKIGYFADGPWSHKAFYKIIEDKRFEIKFICVRYDSSDTVLKEICEKYDIPCLKHKNVNSERFLSEIKRFDCDILVSMSFNQIFKSEIINLTPKKMINCHAGKLPFYRGRNILNWVLINDEKDFGVTVHYVDEGIDTGDIILQNTYPITDDDDYCTILDKAYVSCSETLYESLVLISEGEVHRKNQAEIHPVGMYCGRRTFGDEILDWNQTSREIFNFVRAISKPGPMAHSYTSKGIAVKINKVREVPEAPAYKGICGQVIGKSEGNVLVKTKDTVVEIIEYESECNLLIGERFSCRA